MRRHTIAGRCAAAVSALALGLTMLGGAAVASADQLPDVGTVNITYAHTAGTEQGQRPSALGDVTFHIYRVAMLHDGTVTPVGAFADTARYPISWPQQASEEEYRELAGTLADLIAANGTAANGAAVTDADGQTSFTGLGEGLFLVTADRVDTSTLTCGSSAMLVALPDVYASAGADRMVADIEPKSDCTVPSTAPSSLQVHKTWQDGNAVDRPQSVQVALLRDGEVVQVVELSASNRWTHEWTQLEAGHDWRAVERQVPSGYTMDSDHDASAAGTEVVTITNSKPSTSFTATETPAQTGATTVLAIGVALVAVVLGALLIMRAAAAGRDEKGRRA